MAHNFRTTLASYKHVNEKGLLLKVPFVSISDYMFYLRKFAEVLNSFGSKVLFYLAAAVSDFYIPRKFMVSLFISSVEPSISV